MLSLAIATVHIGVFGALHPAHLEVRPAPHAVIQVESRGRSESVDDKHSRTLSGPARVSGRRGTMTRFILAIPGGMSREYYGRLEIRRSGGRLQAIVEMDVETAVASIVASEGSTSVPFEARKAQAVATRSYLLGAHLRHTDFDFCDSEHCQRLHGPQAEDTAASRAARETEGLIISYQGQIVPALYSANCGGHTKTLKDAGWNVMNYPYHSVLCPRKGRASGHGVGLCQLGSMDLAKHGVGYREILAHYFPETTLERIEAPAPKLITGGRGNQAIHMASARPASTSRGASLR